VKRIERQKLDAMLGYCETTHCRRRVLLDYFGETLDAGYQCGNCDNCLEPPETIDGTVPAQKLLSAALRTGQRFGAGHLIDLLLGKATPRMVQFGHDRLPTFAAGTEFDDMGWRAVARQLIAAGYLHANAERFGALQLTESARALLKGEVEIRIRKVSRRKAAGRDRSTRPASMPPCSRRCAPAAAGWPPNRASPPMSCSTMRRWSRWRCCIRRQQKTCDRSAVSATPSSRAMARHSSRRCAPPECAERLAV
jgi:superfamily II DNA helicase RecQ